MTYDEVLEFFGTQVQIGNALGIKQSAISKAWRNKDGVFFVPDHYQYQLEIITAGKLRIDEHLRRPRNEVQQVALGGSERRQHS